MLHRAYPAILAVALTLPAGLRADPPKPSAPPPDLAEYVAKKDSSFAWESKGKVETPAGTVFEIALTSQTWQGGDWKHGIQVFLPKDCKPTATILLYNTGGSISPTSGLLGVTLAAKVKAPVVFLYDVPNQPLLGGKKEDALIAETFVRYLEKEDPSMPLLFPMVKSVTRAMDAVQAFAKAEWAHEIKSFVICGASKRGWTAWLTAAAGDPRVVAISPLVIDNLNFLVQMAHQIEVFGKPSDMIADYTKRKLIPPPDGTRAVKLWSMVDPWVYRKQLTMPKLIVNGANDPYWATDALNFYWDDLTGPKAVIYVPNAGHNLEQDRGGGRKDRDRVVNGLSAFAKSEIFGTAFPKQTWKHSDVDGKPTLVVTTDMAPKAVRVWTAEAKTKDFRKSTWIESTVPFADGKATATAEPPGEGYRAFFAECEYELDGLTFWLSTQMRVLGK